MAIDTFLIYAIILYLPGIIWGFADLYFGHDRNMKMLVLLFKVHVFGIITYTLTIDSINLTGMLFNFDTNLQNPLFKFGNDFKPEDYENEIRLAFFASLLFSLVWIYGIKHETLRVFLIKIKAIDIVPRTGIVSMAVSLGQSQEERVRIRDFICNRAYSGTIIAYSEEKGIIEVVLKDVEICDIDGNHLGKATHYCISREAKNFDMEILN